MKKFFFLIFCTATLFCKAQTSQPLDTVKAYGNYENIYLRKLYSDSLVSSFVIFIKKEVKAHRHVYHTEQVVILDGEGEMLIGDKKSSVRKGDILFIPKGTLHSLKVLSPTPMKVLSIQAPFFDGKDRVMAEEPK